MSIGRSARLKLAAVTLALGLVFLSSGVSPLGVAAPPPDPVAIARAQLERHLQARGARAKAADFSVAEDRESPAGRHIHFQQRVNGLPLVDSFVSVSLRKRDGGMSLVTGEGKPHLVTTVDDVNVSAGDAGAIARSAAGAGAQSSPAEAVYFATDKSTAARAWQMRVSARAPLGAWLVIVSTVDGTVLSQRSLLVADHPTSIGQVFDPNPVVSSGGTVPPPSDCDSAANEALLTGQYVNYPLLGITSGQGKLKGQYVDLTAPGILTGYKPAGQANEASHVYIYPCNDDRFEEAVIYYHVDSTQRLAQSLGFTGASAILDSPLPAYAHYFAGCNAFYSVTPPSIFFGDGCKIGSLQVPVDFAEDADVIVHEYGHALQDDAVAGTYFATFEGSSLGEGFADFLAASVHGDSCVFEWIVAVVYPGLLCVRTLDNARHYPEDFDPDEHITGLIWGGALWDLVQGFGGDEAARMKVLTLALQSHFYLNQSADFADAAAALRQADIDLYSGADTEAIALAMEARGIVVDSDGDGCEDGRELGLNQSTGGGRNPKYVWDFLSVFTGNPLTRDKFVGAGDLVALVSRFGANDSEPGTFDRNSAPLSTPSKPVTPSGARANYHPNYDRGGTMMGGDPWDLLAADGSIGAAELAAAVIQFGHNCST